MDPITGLAIGSAVAGGVGQLLGSNATNEANKQIAADNREFQERMSNTAYQRAMADMKKANLNPALMFGSGGPAGTPAGSTYEVKTPDYAGIGSNLGRAMLEGRSAHDAHSIAEQQQETGRLNQTVIRAQALKTAADTEQTNASTAMQNAQLKVLQQKYPLELKMLKTDADWQETMKTIDAISKGVGTITNAAGAISDFLPYKAGGKAASDALGKAYEYWKKHGKLPKGFSMPDVKP